tara:strand:- start:130922 stop:131158 length:237 start_codon:yes stop_codon:yes gene_type:complete
MTKKDLSEMRNTFDMGELDEWFENNQHHYVLVKKDELKSLEESLDEANDLLCRVWDSGIKLDELETPIHEYLVGASNE